VGFRYALRWADGDDAGTAEYPDDAIQAGDEIRIDGNSSMGKSAYARARNCGFAQLSSSATPA
jgi:hypothetical protein